MRLSLAEVGVAVGGGVGDLFVVFFFQAEDGIRDYKVTGVQTCALPICDRGGLASRRIAGSRAAGERARGTRGPGADAAAAGGGRGAPDRAARQDGVQLRDRKSVV